MERQTRMNRPLALVAVLMVLLLLLPASAGAQAAPRVATLEVKGMVCNS